MGSPSRPTEPLSEGARRVAASRTFSRADQLQRLLLYLCDESQEGDADRYTSRRLAADVFNRRDFDPHSDAVVRTQMLRLRQKLKEYYESEGSQQPYEITFEKNSYHPLVVPRKVEALPAPTHRWRMDRRFAFGAVAGAAAASVCFLAWVKFTSPHREVDPFVAGHPIWERFRGTRVDVAISTPLFFRNSDGFERHYGLNLPSDLDFSRTLLRSWPAVAQWDYWTAYDDATAAAQLMRFLTLVGATPVLSPARSLSAGDLGARNLIIIGHPRGAPPLQDLLAGLDMRPPEHVAGRPMWGILNTKPLPGEQAIYATRREASLDSFYDDAPDHALLTVLRSKTGMALLSIFGTKVHSASAVFGRLMEPLSLRALDEKLHKVRSASWTSLQVVFKVEYSEARPTGIVPVAARLR